MSRFESEFAIVATDTETNDSSDNITKALDKCEDDECECDEERHVYEWPEATRKYRLGVEGLSDDFAKYKTDSGDQSADSDIRTEEDKTPGMSIQAVAEGVFIKVRDRLAKALRAGEISPITAKSNRKREQEIKAIVKSMTSLKGDAFDDMYEAMLQAIRGGQDAGLDRLAQMISASGSSEMIRFSVSKEISKMLEKKLAERVERLVGSMVEDTISNFANGLSADFSIDEEIERLKDSYGMSRGRAQVIARTESANAYHEGQIDTWKTSGVVTRKFFLMAAGACQFCQAVNLAHGENGGESLPIDAPMVRGGVPIKGVGGGVYVPKFDSPGIVHPNCRCDFVPELKGFKR